MQYTKDILLDMRYKRRLDYSKFKKWTSSIGMVIKNNRLIITMLVLLSSLIVIDITLVNSFLQLLSTMY